jgi:hypothetical protein
MIRKLVRRLNESVVGRLSPERRKIQVPIAVSIKSEITGLRHGKTGKLVMSEELPVLRGETVDLSSEGFAFVVPCIRIGQNYLVGAGKTLNVELDLPKGKVHFQAVGQRYEPISRDASVIKYLIGARISQMSERDREIYTEYLEHGVKAEKSGVKKLVFGTPNS